MEQIIFNMSLVVLIGSSGTVRAEFARRHFQREEILSADSLFDRISNDQSVDKTTFERLYDLAEKRLKQGNLTVIDAANLQREQRQKWVLLAKKYHMIPLAIAFDFAESLEGEGFSAIYRFQSAEEVGQANIVRKPLWVDRRTETGPFDIIGDVHGCFSELVTLLKELGYQIKETSHLGEKSFEVTHPENRKLVFVGDLVDRGANTPDVLRLVMAMVKAGNAFCVRGNHDGKLWRKLVGYDVQVNHGLEVTMEQFAKESDEWIDQVRLFLEKLPSHYLFDQGKLVVAHAGLKEEMQGRDSKEVRIFAMFGETTGRVDKYGLPERLPWARHYRGRALVVHGHTPQREPLWMNNTVNIDTGCVFGGKLTALRYPERVTFSIKAKKKYAKYLYWEMEKKQIYNRKL
jgi:protein phosphatase